MYLADGVVGLYGSCGVYYGQINNTTVKYIDDGKTDIFVEVCPLKECERYFSFILSQNFLIDHADNVSITDLKGGYQLTFFPVYNFTDFIVLTQFKDNDIIATVYKENGLKLCIETPNDYYVQTLRLDAESVEIKKEFIGNCQVLIVLLNADNTTLLIFTYHKQIKQVFCREIVSYSIDNQLKTSEEKKDVEKHVINCLWEFDGNSFKKGKVSVQSKTPFNRALACDKIIPYAFLEALVVGDCIDEYLSENLTDHADKLNSYLGEFIGVMPPPEFRPIDQVGLIKHKDKLDYYVDYFSFEIKDKKICNIKKSVDC